MSESGFCRWRRSIKEETEDIKGDADSGKVNQVNQVADVPAPDEEDGDAGGEDDEAEHGHDHRHQVEVRVAH